LGGCIGRDEDIHQYVQDKVSKWVGCVEKLSDAAEKYPQTVYAAFTKSLQFEWTYLQRVIQGCDEEFEPLKVAIQNSLVPAILGREILYS